MKLDTPAEDAPAPVVEVQDAPVVEAAPAMTVKADALEQEGPMKKTPAELLAMHEADPVTWTRRKLAEAFCPLPENSPFNSKKSWLQRELKKVTNK